MIIEQPPRLFRAFFPWTTWRIKKDKEKTVYLTFDDGPIPEVTEWVLDTLDRYGVKATFFCVGDNVRKHPDIFKMVVERGHSVGNHTFNHLRSWGTSAKRYCENVEKANQLIHSPLFRPPHGIIRPTTIRHLRKRYRIVMWDVVTRDYNKDLTPDDIVDKVKRYTRDGSIIVFHDSLKARKNIEGALCRSIEWLLNEGYSFKKIEY